MMEKMKYVTLEDGTDTIYSHEVWNLSNSQ